MTYPAIVYPATWRRPRPEPDVIGVAQDTVIGMGFARYGLRSVVFRTCREGGAPRRSR